MHDDRSFRQQEVISTTDNSEEATIAEKFLVTKMGQDGILLSTIKRHSHNYYTAYFSNKYYETGTLHLNMSDSSTMVISKEYTMIHVLGVAMIQKFSLKSSSRSLTPGDKRQ